MQDQIIHNLQEVNDCCLLIDECEYLSGGRGNKIDVLRQIYDQTENVTMVLSGTYRLKELLSGANNHNQPQIFRRLIKAEFGIIKNEEILNYLTLLENEFVISFSSEVRRELCILPNDQNNGGLGIFFAILECILSLVRPEWREICFQNRNNEKWDRPECSDAIKNKQPRLIQKVRSKFLLM